MNKKLIIDNQTLLNQIRIHLSQGRKVRLRAKGESMRPFIHGNDDILVLTPPWHLHIGDVVFARTDKNRYVVHRIIGSNDNAFTLMGDANLYHTEKCLRSDVYGKLESIIRNGKVHGMVSPLSMFHAKVWRLILPLRRIMIRNSNKINGK